MLRSSGLHLMQSIHLSALYIASGFQSLDFSRWSHGLDLEKRNEQNGGPRAEDSLQVSICSRAISILIIRWDLLTSVDLQEMSSLSNEQLDSDYC